MAKDVLITPLSSLVEFKNTAGTSVGTIDLDGSDYLSIQGTLGLVIGDPTADWHIGDGIANVDLVFDQTGEIRASTGITLTVGAADANLVLSSLNWDVSAAGVMTATGGNSTQWNTAYGWGDHSVAGYSLVANNYTMVNDTFTGTGAQVDFVLTQEITDENTLIVFIEGVFQTQSAYSINTVGGVTTLTFSVAPENTRTIVVYTTTYTGIISGSNLNLNSFTGNGSTTAFTLSIAPLHENNTQVYFDGVYQQKDGYTVSGTTITFDTAPPNGVGVEIMTLNYLNINEPGDGTVTSAKLSGDLVAPGALTVTTTLNTTGAATFSGSIKVNTSQSLGDLTLTQTADSKGIAIIDSTESGALYLQNNAANTYIANNDTRDLILATNLSDRLTLDGTTGAATFSGTVSALNLTSTTGILNLDGVGAYNGIINAPASLFINIDADNNSTGERFAIHKNASTAGGGTELFSLTEAGAATFTGDMGIGTGWTTQHKWDGSGMAAIDLGQYVGLSGSSTIGTALAWNTYYDGSNWKYKVASVVPGWYYQDTGGHHFRIAASGSADATVTGTVNSLDLSGVTATFGVDVFAEGHYLRAGTQTSTGGSVILEGYYASGALTVIGSDYSSGGAVIGYGVKPSTSASGQFISSTAITLNRGAYIVADTHRWFLGGNQTVAVDGAVTVTETMRIDPAGNLELIGGGNVVMNSGSGISFAATANSSGVMEQELLNDYEQGYILLSTTGFTYGTYDRYIYTKIGRTVTISVYIAPTAVTSNATGWTISLPFPAVDPPGGTTGYTSGCMVQSLGGGNDNVHGYLAGSLMYLYRTANGGAWTQIVNSEFSTSTNVYFSTTYMTA